MRSTDKNALSEILHINLMIRGSIPGTGPERNYSLRHSIQTGCGTYSASYQMRPADSFLGGKAVGAWNWHLALSLRILGSIPPLPQYVFVAWYLVKHRDNLIFTFTFTFTLQFVCVGNCKQGWLRETLGLYWANLMRSETCAWGSGSLNCIIINSLFLLDFPCRMKYFKKSRRH